MSFLNKLAPNKPTASLEGYFITMLAPSKFGKTTFAIDLAREFYGNLDSTLLLGTEIGYKAMGDVFAIPVTGFDSAQEDDGEQRGFVEVVDELIENKDDIPFRFIIIDTITALERYAIAHAIRLANHEDQPKVRYTDISDVPWGKGYTMTANLVYDEIDKLKKAGFGVFIIGHTKTKKIKNKDGFEYDYTTFNVLGKTSDIIEREADMIMHGELQVEKGKEKGSVVTNRLLKFRSDGNLLCGTRFRNFPDEIESDASVFLEAFKNAILGLYKGDEKAVKKALKEQKASAEVRAEKVEVAEKAVEDKENLVDTYKEEIGTIVKTVSKTGRMECGKFFTETLGDIDFRKSDDLDGLLKALEFVKSKV